jgi:starch synthase
MRYGSIPLVRKTGGLADTVIDITEPKGYGIVFDKFNLEEFIDSVNRGVEIYNKKELFEKNRKKIMKLDFSWKRSTKKYIELYKSLIPKQL